MSLQTRNEFRDDFTTRDFSSSSFDLQTASVGRLGSMQGGNASKMSSFGGIATPNISAKNQRITALYLRLSNDDKNTDESDSIANQRTIGTRYAEENGLSNIMEFVDDGWTGVDFHKRPGFQQMMAMVESGHIGTVIVKDLSRLGRERNYMGIFMEYIFPKFGVRFISIGESVDSSKGDNDMVPLINLFNEWHVKSTSQKVRAVKDMKARQGKRSGGFAPYGYIFDKELDKLVIDEETAPTVRRIFDLYLSGLGYTKIAKILTANKILAPTIHKGHSPKRTETAPEEWSGATVSDILGNKVFIGHTVSKRTYSISYKHKQRIANKEEDMITVCNTHEAIIDEETFNIVRNLRHGKRRPTKNGEMVMFSGLLECPTCGRKHQLMKGGKENRHEWRYVCGSYRKKGRDCKIHSIMLGPLEKIVAEHLRMITDMVAIDEVAFAEKLMEKGTKSQKSDTAKKKAELDKSKRRVAELDTLYNKIYEDMTFGRLTGERYQRMATAYENEHQTLTVSIATLEQDLAQNADAVAGADKFIAIVKKYIEVKELTPMLLRELIEKIVVHDKVRTDIPFFDSRGRPRKPITQQIDIYYNFVGVLE